jgi:hypothetical protein
LASGHIEVREIEVAARKAEVTRTISTSEKRMNSVKPPLPRVARAISAIERPPERTETNSAARSCAAPKKMPPRMIQNQPGA